MNLFYDYLIIDSDLISEFSYSQLLIRKIKEREHEEKIDNMNEKFTYGMQSFQTNLGNMSAKINEQNQTVS